jgi:hypothetical protein
MDETHGTAWSPRTAAGRPTAGYLQATDDYVVRVGLPGAVIHDCTLAQAQAFNRELQAVIATAARVEARDRRVRR